VLTAIEPNEPVLSSRSPEPVSADALGAGGPRMKAVTFASMTWTASAASYCRANRVRCRAHAAVDKENASTQGRAAKRRVLAVDQIADEKNATPIGGREVGDARSRHARGPEARPSPGRSGTFRCPAQGGEASSEKRVARHAQGPLQRHDRGPRTQPSTTITVRRGTGRKLQRTSRGAQQRAVARGPGEIRRTRA